MALKNLFVFLVLTSLVAVATASRSYSFGFGFSAPGYNLTARIENSPGELIECWKSLLTLNSCSFATIEFFLTGKTDLSSKCCTAIELSISECSTSGYISFGSQYTSIGFTPQESDILSAYCASLAPVPAPSPA